MFRKRRCSFIKFNLIRSVKKPNQFSNLCYEEDFVNGRCADFFGLHTHAQEVQLGVKAGLNLSTVTGDVAQGVDPRLAYHFGGFANIPISERFSVSPELLYFSIGNTFNFSVDNFDVLNPDPTVSTSFKSVQRANFLAIPLNFRFNFTSRFGLDFGPQLSFLINSVGKLKKSNNLGDIPEKTTDSGNFRPDYGANIGVTFSPNEK